MIQNCEQNMQCKLIIQKLWLPGQFGIDKMSVSGFFFSIFLRCKNIGKAHASCQLIKINPFCREFGMHFHPIRKPSFKFSQAEDCIWTSSIFESSNILRKKELSSSALGDMHSTVTNAHFSIFAWHWKRIYARVASKSDFFFTEQCQRTHLRNTKYACFVVYGFAETLTH